MHEARGPAVLQLARPPRPAGGARRPRPREEVSAPALDRMEIMDRTGFDAVWLAEHHFTTFSVCPSVHMLGTLAAARTRRLRIGPAGALAPPLSPPRPAR